MVEGAIAAIEHTKVTSRPGEPDIRFFFFARFRKSESSSEYRGFNFVFERLAADYGRTDSN